MKKNKRHQSPKADRTYPSSTNAVQEQEIPASPGKVVSKPGFLSRFRSNKSVPQPSESIPLPPVPPAGRVTPEQSDGRRSTDRQKPSQDNSPKSITISLASSTYRNLSQSLTDIAGLTSRSKPSSPDIEPAVPPLPSPSFLHTASPGPEKPIVLPFRIETIQRQGWLNKRPDSDLKRSKSGSSVVWKLQRAIVHDSRLYLYNPPSNLGIKAFAPVPSLTLAPTDLPSPPLIKHSHSPSEGVAALPTPGQLSLEELTRRPSTAPHAIHSADPNNTNEKNKATLEGAVRLDDEGRIVGGTLYAICNHVLCNTSPSTDRDYGLFCTTTGFWAPVDVILGTLTQIASRKDVSDKVDAMIRFWCDLTPRILWDEGGLEALLLLVDEGVTRIDRGFGRALADYVVAAEKHFKQSLQESSKVEAESIQSDVDFSGLAEQGLTCSVLLQIPAEIIAEQLFIFHLKYLIAVDPAKDMSCLLDRTASPRFRSPLVFSPHAPHFLTRLVYTHVLGLDAPEATFDTSLRASFLTRWIEIGQFLKARGDLAGFLAIATALLSLPILRLKETWTDVEVDLRSMVIREWSPMMKELHRRELGGGELSSLTAHVLTPDLKREDLDSHLVIPYYGDICTALEGFDIWAVAQETDVDFAQVRKAYTSVEHAINRWVKFKQETRGERTSPDTFFAQRSKALQICFEELHGNFADGFPYTAEQLFEASIQAEPLSQGAYIEQHYAKRLSVTSGSYVPLMLTDVLPSYKLFEQTDLLEALATVEKRVMYGSQNATRHHHQQRPQASHTSALTGARNKPSPLRRTNSYPPARALLATTGNPDLDYSTHNRIAGLTSRHFPMLKTLRDIAGVEQSLLHVQDGELVLKVVTDTKRLSRPGSMIIETSSKRASLASKRSSAQIFGSPALITPPAGKINGSAHHSFHPENGPSNHVDVVAKAGSLDRLVDVLVLGIEDFSGYLLEDNVEGNGKKPPRLQTNLDEFRTTFLATFRSFCSPTVLLEYLRKRYKGAVFVAAHVNEDEDSEDFSELFPDWTPIDPVNNDKVDWQLVGKIQCGVLDTLSVWISQYFSDFLNIPTLGRELIRLLDVAQQELSVWDGPCATKPYVSFLPTQIGSMIKALRKAFSATYYRPAYYSSCYQTPVNTIFMPVVPRQTRNDQFNSLFNELDESVLAMYQQISIEDWMVAFEAFEIQSADVCGFYPPYASAPTREEDTRLRTIYTIITEIQRPRNGGLLMNFLPRSLRQLHQLHESLTAWIIAQISDSNLNLMDRANRIQSLVNFLRASRQRMSYLDFYTTEQAVIRLNEERGENRMGVPSFIASAVASALVSPESRAFTVAWSKVFEDDDEPETVRSQGYDALAEFVYRKSVVMDYGVSRTLTPCLGWIMERMLEIACYVPNMSLESTRLINFDKRRYIFNLISNIVPAADDLDPSESLDQPLSSNSFAYQLISSDLLFRRPDLKAIRDVAQAEGSSFEYKTPRLFRSLIADEQRKNRRDQRRRAEIEKQIRDHQKSRPLGIREAPSQPDLREAARSGRDAKSARGARGMFLRTIRPLSIAIGSNPFGEKPEPRVFGVDELPKSMSITPGTRAAQKLTLGGATVTLRSLYEREFVFSVRTEEGQECWFQGTDANDANGWVQLLSTIAAQNRPNRSKDLLPERKPVKASQPVFGVPLEVLLEREKKEIPWVVDKLLDDLERRGLDEVGLYRVPGSVSSIKALIAALNESEEVDMDDDRWIDVNVVAGTFKSWLRELPTSILTPELYDKFISAVALQDYEEKCYAIRDLVHQLPPGHFNLLRRVIQHLKKIADNESVNHMNAPNLAICVAPVIVTTSSGSGSLAGTMESMGRAQALVRDLIFQCEWIFEKFEEAKQQEESERGMEPDSLEEKEEENKEQHAAGEESALETQVVVGSI